MSYDRSALFDRICDVANTHPEASLSRLAQLIGVHRNTLGHVVEEATGHFFTQWRRQRRLATAESLLVNEPLLSTKQVAARVGLNLDGLDHLFQSALRQTPGQVRSMGRARCAKSQ